MKPGFNDGLSEPCSSQRCVRVSERHPLEISQGLLTSGLLTATELQMKAVQSMGVLATRFWALTNPGQCPTSNSWSKDIGAGLAAGEGSAPWGDVLTCLDGSFLDQHINEN